LPGVSQLYYANYAAHAVEGIQEFIFHLPTTINGLRGKVDILVKCNSSKGLYKLFHQSICFSAYISISFNEVSDVLLGVTLTIKVVEIGSREACKRNQSSRKAL